MWSLMKKVAILKSNIVLDEVLQIMDQVYMKETHCKWWEFVVQTNKSTGTMCKTADRTPAYLGRLVWASNSSPITSIPFTF